MGKLCRRRRCLFWSVSRSVLGPVSRVQWSEEETEDEEEEVTPESGPLKEEEADGGLQINVDEEAFVLPPAGEMEQDILAGQSEELGGRCLGEGFPGPRTS